MSMVDGMGLIKHEKLISSEKERETPNPQKPKPNRFAFFRRSRPTGVGKRGGFALSLPPSLPPKKRRKEETALRIPTPVLAKRALFALVASAHTYKLYI